MMQTGLWLYVYVAIGGALGACSRVFLTQICIQWFGKGFPFGTLLVNVVGSFGLGLIYTLIEQDHAQLGLFRTAVGVGFLGALTTFSTFSLDTLLLLQQGEWLKSIANVVLNVICCLVAAWLAIQLAKG